MSTIKENQTIDTGVWRGVDKTLVGNVKLNLEFMCVREHATTSTNVGDTYRGEHVARRPNSTTARYRRRRNSKREGVEMSLNECKGPRGERDSKEVFREVPCEVGMRFE